MAEKVSSIETKLGTLIAELVDDPNYPGYYIYLQRPDGTKHLMGSVEVDQSNPYPWIEQQCPSLKGYLYGVECEDPEAETEIGQADFEEQEGDVGYENI